MGYLLTYLGIEIFSVQIPILGVFWTGGYQEDVEIEIEIEIE